MGEQGRRPDRVWRKMSALLGDSRALVLELAEGMGLNPVVVGRALDAQEQRDGMSIPGPGPHLAAFLGRVADEEAFRAREAALLRGEAPGR